MEFHGNKKVDVESKIAQVMNVSKKNAECFWEPLKGEPISPSWLVREVSLKKIQMLFVGVYWIKES